MFAIVQNLTYCERDSERGGEVVKEISSGDFYFWFCWFHFKGETFMLFFLFQSCFCCLNKRLFGTFISDLWALLSSNILTFKQKQLLYRDQYMGYISSQPGSSLVALVYFILSLWLTFFMKTCWIVVKLSFKPTTEQPW